MKQDCWPRTIFLNCCFVCFHDLQALCSLLRRDASINFKAKGNSLVSVLACNLLMAAYEEDENWPEIFVKVSSCCFLFLSFVCLLWRSTIILDCLCISRGEICFHHHLNKFTANIEDKAAYTMEYTRTTYHQVQKTFIHKYCRQTHRPTLNMHTNPLFFSNRLGGLNKCIAGLE